MTSPQRPTDKKQPDRRRAGRKNLGRPVTVTGPSGTIEGRTENLNYFGLLIQSSGTLPAVGEECEVSLDLGLGTVRSRAKVVRHVEGTSSFAVELTHVIENGQLLLATLLTPGGEDDDEE